MLSTVAPVAMLFVRCERGISHHPAEAVRAEDVAVALDVTDAAARGARRVTAFDLLIRGAGRTTSACATA